MRLPVAMVSSCFRDWSANAGLPACAARTARLRRMRDSSSSLSPLEIVPMSQRVLGLLQIFQRGVIVGLILGQVPVGLRFLQVLILGVGGSWAISWNDLSASANLPSRTQVIAFCML